MVEDRLNSLLLAWQEQQYQGREVPVAELCRDCPELAEELSERIAVLGRMNELAQPPGVPARQDGVATPADPGRGNRLTGQVGVAPIQSRRRTGEMPAASAVL